jgi:aubergine
VGKSLTKDQQEEQVCADRATIMSTFLKQALQKYHAINKRLPATIAIYRDGVGGPSYQSKVIQNEVDAVNKAIESVTTNYNPKIIYCLIDKKINTRLVEKQGDTYANPAPGTVVNTSITEHAPGSGSFDFYMVAHKATIATALPVHYFVVQNTTSMTQG